MTTTMAAIVTTIRCCTKTTLVTVLVVQLMVGLFKLSSKAPFVMETTMTRLLLPIPTLMDTSKTSIANKFMILTGTTKQTKTTIITTTEIMETFPVAIRLRSRSSPTVAFAAQSSTPNVVLTPTE